ncbi:uncharacterized protein N7498_002109 [Penicillium cinerascens]|uniref:Uncharacterized protein n=1 Tax=Penicillium cinerascens TaxID=70096 RepID=A0A9W9TAL6_9EURO|nr:uncharacterized protein N7498_002109 [Penicillium cinerascens]KAJ5215702.1 hypothetical protein N7498_002109 [Penicillium cinerascens]
MYRSLVLAAAALTGLANGHPVREENLLQHHEFCLLETLVVDILRLDSKADAFCTSVLNIKTATKTLITTSTPAVATDTATEYTTGTVTTTTTATVTDTISDFFTATEVDFLTVPVTEVVDVTNTVSTTVTFDQTETATATDYFTAIITDTVSDTVTSTVTATSTAIVYDRRNIREHVVFRAAPTPFCLERLDNLYFTSACSCLKLCTPTVTTHVTVVAATPTVTITTTLPVTATEVDTVTATAMATTDITDTETVTSTVPSTVYASSFFTDVESISSTDYATVTATADSTVTETATVTTDVAVFTTVQAVATATQVCTVLAIEKFILADTDQTTVAEANLYSGSDIIVNTNSLYPPFTNPYPPTDPWYGNLPCLSMLFTCDSEQRVFINYQDDGSFTIVPGYLTSSPSTYAVSATVPPTGCTITIYAVVWGLGLIPDSDVISALYSAHINGEEFQWSNTFFGTDTWYGYKKAGAIYYTDATGTMQAVYGREGSYGTI